MKKILARLFFTISLVVFGAVSSVQATMIFSQNDYTCGWEKYTAYEALTKQNSYEIGMNLAVYAAGNTTNISFGQLNYGGDWYTDIAEGSLTGLQSHIQGQLPTATVIVDDNLSFDELANVKLVIMAGHNAFNISATDTGKLKTWIDGGGVLFVDDCNNVAASPFLTSFNTLINNMYGITNAGLTTLPASHLLYSSYYTLDGSDFSYTAAGNGTQWWTLPLRGYENHPNQTTVPEPATMLLLGIGLMGLAGIRRKMK